MENKMETCVGCGCQTDNPDGYSFELYNAVCQSCGDFVFNMDSEIQLLELISKIQNEIKYRMKTDPKTAFRLSKWETELIYAYICGL